MWGITTTPTEDNTNTDTNSSGTSGTLAAGTASTASTTAPAHGGTTAATTVGTAYSDSSSGYDSRTADDDAVWLLDERRGDTANTALQGDAYSTLRARYAAGLLGTVQRKQWQCTLNRQACLALVRN
jgi:hypothetical protein